MPRKASKLGVDTATNFADILAPVSKQNNRAASTMDAIKTYIVEKNLVPGDPLPTETQLCEQLGVSRSSVREAIRKLETLNIVSVEHGRGTFVGTLSLDPIVQTLAFRASIQGPGNLTGLRDVVEVRRYLDLGCSQEIVASLAGTEQPELTQIVDAMEAKAAAGQNFQEEDINFHLGLLAKTSNMVVKQLVHSLWLVHMAVLPELNLQISHRLEDTARAHRLILDAATKGDVDAYQEAVIWHYEPLEEILQTRIASL
ncbi:MAG: GntR family transcriptional regulator [Actinomycetaceae bacterium]|nr:GntR family transcriptional regulator [Actinomycetaceae bacterium]